MPKRKARNPCTNQSYNKVVLGIAIIAIVISSISIVVNQLKMEKNQEFPSVLDTTTNISLEGVKAFSLDGFVKAEVRVVGSTLLVGSGCKAVIMTPTDQQIYSILIGLGNVTDTRPQTHDLIREVFTNYGIELLQAKIEREEDDIYYARLIIRRGDKILSLDSRPTDVIATALREGKDVFISQEVLDRKGKDICQAAII